MLTLVRYSEIALKSRNVRLKFEKLLIEDIKKAMKYYGIEGSIKKIDGRIVVESERNEFLEEIGGVVSFSPAIMCNSNIDEIRESAMKYGKRLKQGETFALRVRRSGKHDFSSMDIARIVGDDIRIARNAKVNLDEPSKEIFIEIRQNKTFIFDEVRKGMGGLPYKSQGNVMCIVDGMNDMKAAWLMVRRGCRIIFVRGKERNVEEMAEKMMKWRDYEIAEREEAEKKAKAIVMADNKFMKLSMPLFYPLIAEEYIPENIFKHTLNEN